MATCVHHNTIPEDVLWRIPESQGGSGRHRCVVCAYAQGIAAAQQGAITRVIGGRERCRHNCEAPTGILRGLPESQGGGGRHKCCNCAFQFGFQSANAALEARVRADVETEDVTHGVGDLQGRTEGREIFRLSRTYERDLRNRIAAIRAHGTTCAACGFNFDAYYGADYARSYIEIHHLHSLARGGERQVDPVADLKPLCANCHSMVHRRSGVVLSIEDLRQLIEQARMRRTAAG